MVNTRETTDLVNEHPNNRAQGFQLMRNGRPEVIHVEANCAFQTLRGLRAHLQRMIVCRTNQPDVQQQQTERNSEKASCCLQCSLRCGVQDCALLTCAHAVAVRDELMLKDLASAR